MSISDNTITKRKNDVAEPNGSFLLKGLGFPAIGMIGFMIAGTEDLDPTPKMLAAVAGIIFCIVGIVHIIIYFVQLGRFNRYIPKWDKGRGFFDRFAIEMNKMDETGEIPQSCDSDMRYHLALQKKRLDFMNLRMHSLISPAKDEGAATISQKMRSPWYSSDINREQIVRRLSFENSTGKKIYSHNMGYIMSQTVIHSPDDNRCQTLSTVCPNCGAVSRVAALEQGCEYCGTKFTIRDLFPYVTNTYFVKSNTRTKNSALFTASMLISIAVVFAGLVLYGMANGQTGIVSNLFASYTGALIAGGFLGLIAGDVILAVSGLNRDGMRHIPVFKYFGAKNKVTNIIKRYDPNFLYEKFEGQVISLIKMAVFTDDPCNLASYKPDVRDPRFNSIVDMVYGGAMIPLSTRMEGNLLYMTLRTWWCNHVNNNGAIKKSGDLIDVTICRNVANMQTPGFSISAVGCPQCGGSFDAVRQKKCPFCGNEIYLENENWVITDMEIK